MTTTKTDAETYTVTTHDGDYPRRGLTLAQAADEILSSDGREWEIRLNAYGGYRLWGRQQVANIGWEKLWQRSYAPDRATAEAEIFGEVIYAEWRGHDVAQLDRVYDAMLAEVADDA